MNYETTVMKSRRNLIDNEFFIWFLFLMMPSMYENWQYISVENVKHVGNRYIIMVNTFYQPLKVDRKDVGSCQHVPLFYVNKSVMIAPTVERPKSDEFTYTHSSQKLYVAVHWISWFSIFNISGLNILIIGLCTYNNTYVNITYVE